MPKLITSFSTLQGFTKYIEQWKNSNKPISILKSGDRDLIALDSDNSGSFVVLELFNKKLQCKISLVKLKAKVTNNIVKPIVFSKALKSTGWAKSKQTDNLYLKNDPEIFITAYNKYLKKDNLAKVLIDYLSIEDDKSTPNAKFVTNYMDENKLWPGKALKPITSTGEELEKLLRRTIKSNKQFNGITLFPSSNGGWQGSIKKNVSTYTITTDKDPIGALVKVLIQFNGTIT